MTLTKKKKKRLRDKKSTVFFFVLQAQSVIVWYGGLELLKSNNPNDENQVFVIEFKSILWYSKTWLEKNWWKWKVQCDCSSFGMVDQKKKKKS